MSHQHHGIDYIEFCTDDLEAFKSFYSSAFGWQFNDHGPQYAGIQKPGGGEMGGVRSGAKATAGGPLVVLYSKNLEDTVTSVKKAGGTIIEDIFEFPGGRRFEFKDVAGNHMAVWSN